jgi:hypothetical protein
MAVEPLKEVYETPRILVRGVFLCDSIAAPVFSPVRRVDVNPWVDGGETTATDGGDVWLPV